MIVSYENHQIVKLRSFQHYPWRVSNNYVVSYERYFKNEENTFEYESWLNLLKMNFCYKFESFNIQIFICIVEKVIPTLRSKIDLAKKNLP